MRRTVRRTLRITLALTVLALVAATACRDDARTVRVDAEDNGGAVTLRPGDRLRVVLRGNPTTGYHWDVLDVDPRILTLTDKEDFDPDSDADGSSGSVTVSFEALAPGSTTLLLGYQPEYQTNRIPSETFGVAVTVIAD